MIGAVFDGQYVYFIPVHERQQRRTASSCDTTHMGPSKAGAPAVTFDVGTLGTNVVGFAGGAFDGRYVYMAPSAQTVGVVPRFDTRGNFTDPSSWSTFDTSPVQSNSGGFVGAAYDGRFVYLIPYLAEHYDGVVLRYDTTLSFNGVASWSTFDTTTVSDVGRPGSPGRSSTGSTSTSFPTGSVSVLRFDARTPPAVPTLPEFHGSFF